MGTERTELPGIPGPDLTAADEAEADFSSGWLRLSDRVFVSVGAHAETNSTLVVSRGQAILVDTGADRPEALRVAVHLRRNGIQLRDILLTHRHADHCANLEFYRAPPERVHDPASTPDGTVFEFGGMKLRAVHTPGHHERGDMGIEIVGEGIYVAGDVLFTCLPAMICYGADEQALRVSFARIRKAAYPLIVPGHGRPLDGTAMVDMAEGYLAAALAKVEDVVSRGGGLNDALAIPLDECFAHPDWLEPNVSRDIHAGNLKIMFKRLAVARNRKG